MNLASLSSLDAPVNVSPPRRLDIGIAGVQISCDTPYPPAYFPRRTVARFLNDLSPPSHTGGFRHKFQPRCCHFIAEDFAPTNGQCRIHLAQAR